MRRFSRNLILATLICAITFTLAVRLSAQTGVGVVDSTAGDEHIYPSRIGNYCLFADAIATASSTAPAFPGTGGFPASSAIDGDRVGQYCPFSDRAPCWGNAGGWNDYTRDVFPDWLRVDFGRARSISRMEVVTYQDLSGSPRHEPYLGLQVGQYGIEEFSVEVLDTSGTWVTVGNAEENEDTIREFTFQPILGTAIRLTITDAYVHYSRVIEFEAYAN